MPNPQSSPDPAPRSAAQPSRKLPTSALRIGIAAAMLGLLYGYDQSNISVAQLYLQDDLGLSTGQVETIATGVTYGTLVGVLLGGYLADRLGRKKSTLLVVVGYTIFCLAQALALDFTTLMIARVLLGITIGVSLIAVPVFIAESVATRRRGSVLVGYQVAEVLGIIIALVVGLALVGVAIDYNWRLMFGIAAIPAVLLFPLVLRSPETARWLMLRGRRAEAAKVLRQIDPDADVDAVLDSVADELAEETGGRVRELFERPYLRATVFLIILGLLIQITGINATITYGPALFKNMGWVDNVAIGMNIVVQVCAFLAVLISMKYVDRWGRRPILIGGFSGLLAGLILVIIAYAGAVDGSWLGWQKTVGFIGFIVMNMAFAFGIGGLVWAFASETLPSRLRAFGATTLLAADLVGNIIVVQSFLSLEQAIGGAQTFGIFAILCIVAIFFVHRYAPETKGRDVDAIRLFWENGGKWPTEISTPGSGQPPMKGQ